MPRKINFFDPFGWMDFALQQQALTLSAAETIARRTLQMGQGTMTGAEAVKMMMEKPSAFAKGYERAAIAAVKGGPPARVAEAFWKPVASSAGANAKRLRS